MNPLVTLLMAAAVTGADPQPVVQETVTPVSSYTYTTEEAPDSRPGFLGRIRNALNPRSPATPTGTSSSQGYQVSGPTVISSPAAPRFLPSDSSREPPLADSVPVTTPAPPAEVRPVTPPVMTPPTYTYPAPSAAGSSESNSRVRFPRLRKLFGVSSSQPSQALPEDAIATPQVVAPSAPAPAAPVIQGQPQRMPIGNP